MNLNSVMLTGATGFIGSHLAERLLHEKIPVNLFARRSTPLLRSLEDQGAHVFVGDPDDPDILAKSLEGVDLVIHCAAATKALCEKDYLKANVGFTENILSLMGGDQRLVFISSQVAAGSSPPDEPIDENVEPAPPTYYGKSKLLAESRIREWGARHSSNYVILRPCIVYGPRERDLFSYFKMLCSRVDIMFGSRLTKFSMLYVADLVNVVMLAAGGKGSGEIFFVANDQGYSWEEIGNRIQAALEIKKVLKIELPEWSATPVAIFLEGISRITGKPALLNRQKIIEMKQPGWLCSNEKLKSTFSWAPEYSLEQGMRMTAAWYRQEGWLGYRK